MKNFVLFSLLFFSAETFSQPNIEDVVYLKNGSVLRGKITENKFGIIKIEIAGGSMFVFQQSETDSIKKENALNRKLRAMRKDYFRCDRGFRNMTEAGIIYGVDLKKPDNNNYYYNYNNADDVGLSLHTVNGYQFWSYLYVGAGMGIDRFINYKQSFSPFYLRVTSEFLKTKVTPYVFCDVGYSHMWKQRNTDYYSYNNKGGLYVSAGGGLRIYTRSRASVILSVAYKRNSSETKWWYTNYDEGTYYTIKRTYQRLAMSVGVTF